MNGNYNPNCGLMLGVAGALLLLNKEFRETSEDHINGLADMPCQDVYYNGVANATVINDTAYTYAITRGSSISQTLTIPNIKPSTTTIYNL